MGDKITFTEITPSPRIGYYTLYHYGTITLDDNVHPFMLCESSPTHDGKILYIPYEVIWVEGLSVNINKQRIEDAIVDAYETITQSNNVDIRNN